MREPNAIESLMRQFAIFIFHFSICSFSKCGIERVRLVSQRSPAVAFHAGGFLSDLDSDAGADASRAGFDHRARVIDVLDATRCFYAQLRSYHSPHQSDVGYGRSAFGKSRGSLDK